MAASRGLLVDELFAATYHPEQRIDNPFEDAGGQRRFALQIRAALISARRFILDEEVVRAATKLGVQHPDILLAMLPRGRLPFSKIWIEWDQRIALDEAEIPIAEDGPPSVGVFVEELSGPGEYPLYRISEMGFDFDSEPPRATVNATSVVYSLDIPILDRMPSLYGERSSLVRMTSSHNLNKDLIDSCLLGATYAGSGFRYALPAPNVQAVDVEGEDDDREGMVSHRIELCRKLVSYASHVFSPFWPSYSTMMGSRRTSLAVYERGVAQSIVGSSGTWRFIVTVLALIQSRDYTSQAQPPRNPAKRRFVGNKVVPYLQHVRISLKLPRQVVLREMIASTREALPRARHEVEGHWKVSHKGDSNCDHVDVSETPTRYRCALCRRARWFQSAHMRGSSKVGFVKKDRVVERRTS